MGIVERIADLWETRQYNTYQMAQKLGISESEVDKRLPKAKLQLGIWERQTANRRNHSKPKNGKPTKKRKCLGDGCNTTIESEHAGHRLCDECRKRD